MQLKKRKKETQGFFTANVARFPGGGWGVERVGDLFLNVRLF